MDLKEAVYFARECFERKAHSPKEPFDAAREAKSLLLSRLMLYSLGLSYLRKFAFFKAREYSRLIEAEEDGGMVLEVARDFFPSLEKAEGGFRVALVEYLEYGHGLPQAQVSEGRVFFNEGDLLDCIRQAVETRVADHSKFESKLPEDLKKAALELRDFIPREFAPRATGKLLQRQELQGVLKGVGEGKRYYGAMAIAIACLKDGLPKEEALEVMQSYVENCSGGGHPFTPGEGNSVVEWVYRHPTIGFSFTMMRSQGLIE